MLNLTYPQLVCSPIENPIENPIKTLAFTLPPYVGE